MFITLAAEGPIVSPASTIVHIQSSFREGSQVNLIGKKCKIILENIVTTTLGGKWGFPLKAWFIIYQLETQEVFIAVLLRKIALGGPIYTSHGIGIFILSVGVGSC